MEFGTGKGADVSSVLKSADAFAESPGLPTPASAGLSPAALVTWASRRCEPRP
jgi:hypothetical protein